MATLEKNYKAYNGSKLEYSETEAGVYTQIKGIKQTPDVGGTPNKIDTTDLDNYIKVIPAASLNCSENEESLKEFLNYLDTDEVKAVWEKYGYELVSEK